MTRKVRFIHAADIHMGAPVRGFAALSDEWATRLLSTIPEAYDRVISAALSRKVDFVILAGDIFDGARPSYHDYKYFFDGLAKLHEAGIPVYLVTGNHDPYTAWARDIERLPETAHMLGVGVPTFELYARDNEPLCLIGGRSYYGQAWPLDEDISEGITRQNAIGALTELYPNAADAPFAIGVIHTGLDLDASKAAVPEATLLARDIDYWACGHLHRHFVRPIMDDPRVVFPGCIQGRDIKESGERGCYLVELEEGRSPRIEFVPTASVAFHSLDVDVSDCRTLSDVANLIKVQLFKENGHDYCSEMIARVNLVGATDLHDYLRSREITEDIKKHVNDACTGFFCDGIVDRTQRILEHTQGKVDRAQQHLADDAQGEADRAQQHLADDAQGEGQTDTLSQVLQQASELFEDKGKLIDYIQSTFVQRGIPVPDALARRIDDFCNSAQTLAIDLVAEQGDGLNISEAHDEVTSRIELYTSRSAHKTQSLYTLGNQLENAFVEVRKAGEFAAAQVQADRELYEINAGLFDLAQTADDLSECVENLAAWRDNLQDIESEIAQKDEELAQVSESRDAFKENAQSPTELDPRLVALSVQEDRALRDTLEELSEEREKIQRALEDAKERSANSAAAYEALQEMELSETRDGKPRSQRYATKTVQAVSSVVLIAIFVFIGVASFIHGRTIGSLSFTGFGIGVVVLAFFLAAAAIVMLFRPNKETEALKARQKDAQWVMIQDKKLLDTCIVEQAALNEKIQELFTQSGLDAAEGSIRQAVGLLDDAQEERSRLAEIQQHIMALDIRESSLQTSLAQLHDKRDQIVDDAHLEEDLTVHALENQLRAKTAERDKTHAQLENALQRREQLTEELDQALQDHTFDMRKLNYHQLRARLRIAKHEFITLLLTELILSPENET